MGELLLLALILLLGAPILLFVLVIWNSRKLASLKRKTDELTMILDRLQRLLEGKLETFKETRPEAAGAPVSPVVSVVPPTPPQAARGPIVVPLPSPAPEAPKPAISAEPLPSLPAIPKKRPSFDWEGLVGVRLFSWIAGIALVLAGIFFLRYSIERGWLVPELRFVIGLVVGAGLLLLCELRGAKRYPVTANALNAAGIAILFATFFAAHTRWHLIGTVLAFVVLALVTAVAVLLSVRRESIFIALLGLVGGFATPALLSTGEDRPISLFGYLLILNAGLSWVAYRKRWAVLASISLVFTALYQWSWVMTFLRAANLSLAVGIFLVFPLLGFAALAFNKRKHGDSGWITSFEKTANVGALLPLFFALYLPIVPAYGEHYAILFGFLLCLDIGLLAITIALRSDFLHFAGGLSTILVFAIWLNFSYLRSAWPGVLAFITLFFALYLFAPAVVRRFRSDFSGMGAQAIYAAPLLLAVFPALTAIEPRCAEPATLFLSLLFLTALGALVAVRERNLWIHVIAAISVVLAEALWTGRHLTSRNLIAGLAIYAIFGLLYLCVPVVADWWNRFIRSGVPLSPSIVACLYLGLTAHFFLLFVAQRRSLMTPPWPLLVVLGIMDLVIAVAAIYMRQGALHVAAMVGSSLIMIRWAAVADAAPWPSTAIIASGTLVLFALFCIDLARRNGVPTSLFSAGAAATAVLGQVAVIVAALQPGSPGVVFLAISHVLLLVVLFGLSWFQGWRFLALLAVVPSAIAMFSYQIEHSGPEAWKDVIFFAGFIYLAFVAYPLILGRRIGRLPQPYQAAVFAGAAFFFVARYALIQGGLKGVMGILPVTQAIVTGILLLLLLRIEPPGARTLGRLAQVAATVLAFLTVAIPLQLEKEWTTVGWALEGAALAWLYGRIKHRGILLASFGLLAAVFVRLAMNPSVFSYYPRGLRVWNWYLYAYLISAAAMLLAAWLLSKTEDRILSGWPRVSALLPAGGTILLFLLLNIEIADFYSTGSSITFNFSANLARDLTYTLAWALFALALLGVGIRMCARAARIASIGLLMATVLKCFLHDLARLGGLYRVGSFVGLAVCLALVAILLQKYILSPSREGEPTSHG